MKTKVLLLISHFTPGIKMGGPLTSVINIIDETYSQIDYNIITFDHDLNSNFRYENIVFGKWLNFEKYKVFYISNSYFKLLNLLLYTDCDIIYSTSFFHPFFSISVQLLKKLNIIKPILIISPRGELFNESLSFKKFKKKLYLLFFKLFNIKKDLLWHVSTENEKKSLMDNLNINTEDIHVLRNLITYNHTINFENLETSFDLETLNIIFFARISKDKNLAYVFEILKNVTRKVKFDIYGPIEDVKIWKKILLDVSKLSSNIIVEYKGILDHKYALNILMNYDLFILPTFSENFGNSIVESLLAGTPVLISDKTPWRNLLHNKIGWDFPLENKNDFINVIQNYKISTLDERIKNKNFIRNQFINIYKNEMEIDKYISFFNKLKKK